MKKNIVFAPEDPLITLESCDGYYMCPVDSNGAYLGPLVAYAGKYEASDGTMKQYVGPDYYNFAKAEEHPMARRFFARLLIQKIKALSKANEPLRKIGKLIGAPMGGLFLACELGGEMGVSSIFAEKKIVALADKEKGTKDVSKLIIDRHDIAEGEYAALVEDTCNNFSTTDQIIDLVNSRGAKLAYILCAINRSGKNEYAGLPVISVIYRPSKQFKQEDPEVYDLVKQGKVVWTPKQNWPELKKAMY